MSPELTAYSDADFGLSVLILVNSLLGGVSFLVMLFVFLNPPPKLNTEFCPLACFEVVWLHGLLG